MFMNSVGLEFSLDTVGIAYLCSMMPGNSAGMSGGDSNIGTRNHLEASSLT